MSDIKLYTIGFTKKSAEQFFTILLNNGVRNVIDARLNNTSQLAGFAKLPDLQYFLMEIGNIDYVHRPDLAPTGELLKAYRKKTIDWDTYKQEFITLLRQRSIEGSVDPITLDRTCLLCSEAEPLHCHRRLIAEYLRETLGGINICHL
ncbi:MAG: DUF488 domain-containing protein [Planctomycetota bacterium]|jgi:uncharacterized protein (DUF488 family)